MSMLPNNVWDATPQAPGVHSMQATSSNNPNPKSRSKQEKREWCLAFIKDYYKENYRLLKSRHGNKCLLQDIERVLGIGKAGVLSTRNLSDAVNQIAMDEDYMPMEVYGYWGSCLQRRPTRRRYIPPRIYEVYETDE